MTVRCLLFAGLGLAAGCASAGTSSVQVHWDPIKKLAPLGTSCAWAPEALIADSLKDRNPNMDQVIREHIDHVLAGKGFRQGGGSSPGFWVRYGVARETRQADSGHGSWDEAALAIDALDPADGKIIWRGWLTTRIDYSRDPQKTRARLEAVVRKILNHFPSVQNRKADASSR